MVKIKWYQSRIVPGEASLEECVDEDYDEIDSMGFLIKKDASKTVIAQGKIASIYSDIIAIPNGCIKELSY